MNDNSDRQSLAVSFIILAGVVGVLGYMWGSYSVTPSEANYSIIPVASGCFAKMNTKSGEIRVFRLTSDGTYIPVRYDDSAMQKEMERQVDDLTSGFKAKP